MPVTYIIAIVSAVVLLALNLIRDYGKKGWFLAAILFITQEEKGRGDSLPFLAALGNFPAIFHSYFTKNFLIRHYIRHSAVLSYRQIAE